MDNSVLFEELLGRYEKFIEMNPEEQGYEEVGKRLLMEIRKAGYEIVEPIEREQTAQMARDIGERLFELIGEYLPVRLEASVSFEQTRGTNMIPYEVIQQLSDLLSLVEEKREELFNLAKYSKEHDSNLMDWGNRFFRWHEASDHASSSWAGMVIYTLSVLTVRITPRGTLMRFLAITLWMATAWLMSSVLQWPLDDANIRWAAFVKYGLATLIIPFLVAIFTQPDRCDDLRLDTIKQKATLWRLKLTGALLGFYTFSLITIGLALSWYYVYLPPIPILAVILAIIPLLMSHVAARRIPADRYMMYGGDLRIHTADARFLIVFLFVSPFTAYFLYIYYWFLSDRTLVLVALWPLIIIGIILERIILEEGRRPILGFVSKYKIIIIVSLSIIFLVLLFLFTNTNFLLTTRQHLLVYSSLIIGGLTLFFSLEIAISGFQLLISGGDKQKIDISQSRSTFFIAGLATLSIIIVILAPYISSH